MHARLAMTAGLLLAGAVSPLSAQPANDAWANRTVIPALPFSASEPQAGQATNDATDPDPPCRSFGSNPLQFSLWYGYTTGSEVEFLDTAITGGDIFGTVAVYTGTPGSFRLVSGGCGRRGNSSSFPPRIVGLRLQPGTAYSILVGSQFPVPVPQQFVVNASASTRLRVTKTEDTRDGACNADCSLREAIDAANAAPAVVIVPQGQYAITRTGRDEDGNDRGDFDLRASMGIYGEEFFATIDATGLDRVFDLAPNAATTASYSTFVLGDLILRGGQVVGGNFERDGGNLRQRGGTQYFGFERVFASSGNAQQSGGGMYVEGPGTVRSSHFLLNVSGFSGGGFAALTNPHRVVIEDSSFLANQSLQGGGLQVQGDVLVSNSTFTSNRASLVGGAIATFTGRLTLATSTVVDNFSDQAGGAGGLLLAEPTLAPAHVISGSIIARNATPEPGDASPDCIAQVPPLRSFSLVQAGGACGPAGVGDVTGVPAGVATLGSNGGPTPTYALLAGSPALDAGDPAGCRDAEGALLANDQRGPGFPRTVNGRCDIGALESPLVQPPGTPLLDPASDTGSSNGDGITNDATPRYTGTCTVGTTVTVSANGTPIAPPFACAGGSYDVTAAPALPDGLAFVWARAAVGGNESLLSSIVDLTVDTQPPSNPGLTGPVVSPTFLVTVSGTASEAGIVGVSEGAALRCTDVADAGPWACDIQFATTGPHVLLAREIDVAGNLGPTSPPFTVTVVETLFVDGFE